MRPLLVFILLLASSVNRDVLSCGYYPYGEDIRFSIFNPNYFKFRGFSAFYYSGNLFGPTEYEEYPPYDKETIGTAQKLNVDLWRQRYNNIPEERDVYEAIYLLENGLSEPASKNTFIQCLHKDKDLEAIHYLEFAKKCSGLNNVIADPWERNESATLPQRTKWARQAMAMIETVKNEDIRLRYAFIAIRLAYYNGEREMVEKIYTENFSGRKEKNVIDYWGLYFRTLMLPHGALRNYCAAQVFANAPDKRFMIHWQYEKNIPIAQTLQLARNNNEKAAVWLLAGVRNPARGMESIQNMYALDPGSDGLPFLLLREVNKLEDWIYTPYYTNFDPSLEYDENSSYAKNKVRIAKDRAYAKRILDFIASVSMDRVDSPLFWKIASSYLSCMSEDYSGALVEINSIEPQLKKDKELSNQASIIRALALTARQANDSAVIREEIKPILMRESAASNFKFILAVAKELEYKGNTTDAAILLSSLQQAQYDWGPGVYWKTRKYHHTLWDDFYDNYFFYIDAQYSTAQVNNLIADVESNKSTDVFSIWKYKAIRKDLPRLYDLAGTKNLRADRLAEALADFEKVNDTLWTSGYFPYKTYLDANPFYTNIYNEHTKTVADTITYNKESIVRTLLGHLKKAEDLKRNDRDYYYFLVANCYLNMTQYGNSWMMKRYYWTSSEQKTKLEDDEEYFNCNYAKQYYLKAKETSKHKKFTALCIRMAGRCEQYRLTHKLNKEDSNLSWEDWSEELVNRNKYFAQIKKQYPDYYDDLISNCESFEGYFNSRN